MHPFDRMGISMRSLDAAQLFGLRSTDRMLGRDDRLESASSAASAATTGEAERQSGAPSAPFANSVMTPFDHDPPTSDRPMKSLTNTKNLWRTVRSEALLRTSRTTAPHRAMNTLRSVSRTVQMVFMPASRRTTDPGRSTIDEA